MRYGSVCSGIEAASVAWEPLGWTPAWFCEIDSFPSAVLAHHYPEVTNHGDFTKLIDAAHPVHADQPIDLLVGGTPCQAFSVAGLRAGLADPRGGLTLEFLRLARALRPKWIVWENVPGVLSQDGGRAFGAFLGGLQDLGYGWAYRVLDAQYTRVDGYPGAVPQRRKRVFVVGCAGGDFSRAAAILLEPEGVRRDPPTRRQAGQGTTGGIDLGFEVCGTLSDGAHNGGGLNGQDAYTGRILPIVFAQNQLGEVRTGEVFNTLNTNSNASGRNTPMVAQGSHSVRRLTPVECERLQGFPDNYTRIPWRGKPAEACPDGGRYKALGNSMACNVMRWIGRRIELVEACDAR
jgi:DNA (cytosine-5)-methyltransferase 1